MNLLRRDLPWQGRIPSRMISALKEEYVDKVRFGEEPDDKLFDVIQADWHKRVKERLTPGKNLRIHRQNMSMTQSQLGRLLRRCPEAVHFEP